MNTNQYMDIFVEESREQLQRLNSNLLAIESNPQDIEGINETFRVAHTLKGMAGTMGFKSIASLTHAMENALDLIKSKKLQINSQTIDLLFQCLDSLEVMLESTIKIGSDKGSDVTLLISKINALSDSEQKTKSESVTVQTKSLTLDDFQKNIIEHGFSRGFQPYHIDFKLSETCVLKSARAYIIFKALEALGDIIHSIPSVQDIENEKFDTSFSVVLVSVKEKEEIELKLKNISEVDDVVAKPLELKSIQIVAAEDNEKVDGDSTTANQQETKTQGFASKFTKNIRVDVERLDLLMNLVSELIIIRNRLQGTSVKSNAEAMTESLEYLGKITSDLHDAVMKVRMVAVDTVFSRFPRVVRDLAKSTGKEIRLNVLGGGTELDRTIADEIGDSLIHLIRNAVDHGIENLDERTASGKQKIGNIELSAYHDGNNVVIVVGDDGKGIDTGKLAKQAVNKGLFTAQEADNLTDREKMNILFDPRISTAAVVTDISGRGVGMDAVKTKVESLGGIIDIQTEKGKGTRFLIRLPLTLSIIQALIVQVEKEQFALPLGSIKEILNASKSDIHKVRNQDFVSYRDMLLPLIYLDARLGVMREPLNNLKKDSLTLVVVRKDDRLSAIAVDELVGQQEIVIKSLGKYLSDIRVVSGATILGDGKVITILDLNYLV